jgi:hypothetical protein
MGEKIMPGTYQTYRWYNNRKGIYIYYNQIFLTNIHQHFLADLGDLGLKIGHFCQNSDQLGALFRHVDQAI